MMLICIIIIIAGVIIALLNIFLNDADEEKKRFKKMSTVFASIAIVISGIMQLASLSIDPPDMQFDKYGKRVTFECDKPAHITYRIWHDHNEKPEWVEYREDDPLFINQVPTYLMYRSELWLFHSVSKEATFRKEEDGGVDWVSIIDNGIGSGVEDIVWEQESSYGWGPERTSYSMDNPAAKVVFNSIFDNNKEIGNEFYFVSASEYTGNAKNNKWTDKTYVKENHEYVIRIYVHNNAASNLDLTAHDVRASIMLPNEYARKISVGCKISCPDADPKGVWDGTNFYSDDERSFALTYVEDSLRYYNNAGTFRLQDETQGDYSAFTNKGVLLGFDEMDGVIPGCMQYSGYITFHVKPIFQN